MLSPDAIAEIATVAMPPSLCCTMLQTTMLVPLCMCSRLPLLNDRPHQIRIIPLNYLIKVSSCSNLIHRLRVVVLHLVRITTLVHEPAVIRVRLLRDTRADDGRQGLHALIDRGDGHLIRVVDHGATATAVDRGPAVDGPGFAGYLLAQLRRCARAVGL